MTAMTRISAAQELLDGWIADTRSTGAYTTLAWTMDPDGHLHGELVADDRPYADRLAALTIWADYLGVDLERTDAGLHGTRTYHPDGPTGVDVTVSLTTP
ncbi:hypothetical protein ABZ595_37430 [Streptomyces rubradiris]|uniref:hypothetical protein n=1 Tax=Streptomyces rubradiris TaxID=285531 RepID=UPI0034101C1E